MKLKFRASARDIAIFVIFCIVLLYFVAIAVLNLASFADDGSLHGLNPFPAFTSEYILATIIGFIAVLAFIITSVSSYFFDRDKGIGVTTEKKKEDGYSRWATDKEMKKELKLVKTTDENSPYGGIPIINDGVNMWVDDGSYHSLIIGSTGSGKTQSMVLPLVKILAKHGESMIITDPKGEIYEQTANMLKSKGYNVILLNFRDPQKGNAWNPLALPYSLYHEGNKDKANELLDDLAMNILYDEKAQNQDPFWEKTSADYFAGLALGLFEDAKREEINLNSINLMTTVGEEKIGGTTYIKEYFGYKDPASPAYINVSSTIMAPSDTKSSILSVFKQKIKLFSSRENLSEMLSHSDFDMKSIGREKTAVFIVIQDEKKTYHSLVTIFIKQCYETLIDVAQENGGKLPFRTNFILDEFANMPPLKDVTTMVTAARSRQIRFNFIIQNFAQLYQVYGKDNGETIKGNCGNIIYLISSEIGALEEISKMCGEVKSKEKEKTASTPLVTVSDLQRLKEGNIIILRTRMMPFKTKVVYDYKIDWGYKTEREGYPKREKQPLELFDLKGFVNEKRENKINDVLNNFNNAPIPPMPGVNKNGNKQNLNVDDLIKKIDAKISELEEQEKQEKANSSQVEQKEKSKMSMEDLLRTEPIKEDVKVEPKMSMEELLKSEPVKEEPKFIPNIDIDKLTKRIDAKIAEINEEEKALGKAKATRKDTYVNPSTHTINGVTDDQFFDDFFYDD